MKDFLGNELHPGDTLVYASRVSSSLYLTRAVVVEAEESRVKVKATDTSARGLGVKLVWLRTPAYVMRVAESHELRRPTPFEQGQIFSAADADRRRSMDGTGKIAAIKALRELIPAFGLKEAKDAIEAHPEWWAQRTNA